MKLTEPALPDLDLGEWRRWPFLARIRPMVVHWAEAGSGTPVLVYLLYVMKVGLYAAGGVAVVSTTPGLGSIGDFGSWWTEPIVFQKVVVWTLLFEVLGLGGGSGPLVYRLKPPIGGVLYWVRPGTVRLPPWPGRNPLGRGSTRSLLDVALYLGLVGSAVWLLLSPGVGQPTVLGSDRVAVLAVLLAVLGLRDQTIFLAARAENYWMYLLLFIFPVNAWILGAKVVMVVLWLGVAASKVNHHFSYVVPIMVSNSPLQRSRWFKRKFYRGLPDDVRPSRFGACIAYTGCFFESVPPLVLLFSRGGTATTVALVVMVLWHLHILSTIPVGVPLEWNVFFIFAALFLFGAHADVGFGALHSPLMALMLVGFAALPVVGAVRPDLVSFLIGMRYYAGNWALSFWCYRNGCDARLDERIKKTAPTLKAQLQSFYPPEVVEWFLFAGPAFVAMHVPGRALCGLLPRALDDVEQYDVRVGDFEAGVVLGWNFGDGHLSDEQLLEAVQDRCHFAEGELILVFLESQPIHRWRHHYRIVDAATGLVEEGYVDTADMISRQPWLDADNPTVPVEVIRARRPVDRASPVPPVTQPA